MNQNVKTLVEANKGEIAAIIIEAVAGNMGCIPPAKGFLEGLRELIRIRQDFWSWLRPKLQ